MFRKISKLQLPLRRDETRSFTFERPVPATQSSLAGIFDKTEVVINTNFHSHTNKNVHI